MPGSPAERVPAVVADSVSKTFRIPHERMHTLKERVLHPLRRSGAEDLVALRDVSFAIEPGEFFGIVGRNGSGKSTLLKCLAGIYRADGGRIYIDGRLSAFIELGVGFNPDLAARDNVVLNALMLGLSPREARASVDRVIEFAELEEFADLKLKNYSSGMHVRLAFSVMIQVDAEVLLIDEVLAVGDAAFQQKCFDEFHRLRRAGRTIVLVTHDMSAVNRFCDRAMLLERGDVVALGEPKEVAERYLALNFARHGAQPVAVSDASSASAPASLREVWFEDEYGLPQEFLPHGRRCAFRARLEPKEDLEAVGFSVRIENDAGQEVFATATPEDGRQSLRAGELALLSLDFQNELIPGWRYYLTLVVDEGPKRRTVEERERVASMVVTGDRAVVDHIELDHAARVEREATTVA